MSNDSFAFSSLTTCKSVEIQKEKKVSLVENIKLCDSIKAIIYYSACHLYQAGLTEHILLRFIAYF